MDREANYIAVGAFVMLVLIMAAGFVLWYSDAGDRRAVQRYEIYFNGSVSGLSEGSTVRYLGVAVGRVMRIAIDPRDPGRVRVVADIQESTPIEADTVARLALQGVTGLLTIDLQPRTPGLVAPPRVESLEFPVIPSEQSQFDVLVAGLPGVVVRAGAALDRINLLLSDRNIAAVSATLGNAERASTDLPAAVTDARLMFRDMKGAASEMQVAMQGLGELSGTVGQDVKAAAARLREAVDTLASTATRLDRLVAENEDNVDRFAEEGLAEFEQLMRETRDAVRSFDTLTRSIEQDPSRLIYRPAPAGVEIPP